MQINAAAEVIYEAVDTNANIIFGALVDESMSGEIAITVIATGIFTNTDAKFLLACESVAHYSCVTVSNCDPHIQIVPLPIKMCKPRIL